MAEGTEEGAVQGGEGRGHGGGGFGRGREGHPCPCRAVVVGLLVGGGGGAATGGRHDMQSINLSRNAVSICSSGIAPRAVHILVRSLVHSFPPFSSKLTRCEQARPQNHSPNRTRCDFARHRTPARSLCGRCVLCRNSWFARNRSGGSGGDETEPDIFSALHHALQYHCMCCALTRHYMKKYTNIST